MWGYTVADVISLILGRTPSCSVRRPLLHLSAGSECGSRSVTVPSSSTGAASLFAQGSVLAKTAFKNIHSMLNFKDKNTSDGTQKLREVFSLELSPYLLLVRTDGQIARWRGRGEFTKQLRQFYAWYFSAKMCILFTNSTESSLTNCVKVFELFSSFQHKHVLYYNRLRYDKHFIRD